MARVHGRGGCTAATTAVQPGRARGRADADCPVDRFANVNLDTDVSWRRPVVAPSAGCMSAAAVASAVPTRVASRAAPPLHALLAAAAEGLAARQAMRLPSWRQASG